MHLWDVYQTLAPHFSPSRAKDIKTAVRVLAQALGYTDPAHCPPERYHRSLPQLRQLLDAHLAGKGPHTLRNVKNNLSRFFRTAEAQGLVTPLLVPTQPRFASATRVLRCGSACTKHTHFYLPRRQWPPALETAFAAFATWATAPIIEGRPAAWRKRPITLASYQNHCEAYFGYLHHVLHTSPLSFEHLFDEALIRAFVQWSVTVRHKRVTLSIREFLARIHTLTRQYRVLPDLQSQIQALQRSLPKPTPVYDKTEVWLSLETIDEVGQALWPRKAPQDIGSNGAQYALQAVLSLMLRLWTRRPYRQRNMREMQLDENLYRDAGGTWIIRFAGEQLKVAQKQGQLNTFTLPFPQDLVPHLEEYLQIWRPCLARLTNSRFPHVFLNRVGGPYETNALRQRITEVLYRYTGKVCHPHLIRTIWATEYIRDTGNVYRAAVLLNDRLETVVRRYSHLTEQGVAEQTDQWVQQHFAGSSKKATGQEAEGALQRRLDVSKGKVAPARVAPARR